MASNQQEEIPCPILHVLVVGFHHKKGCQVEYAYPPLIPGNAVDSQELPDEWKHLPSLALPDGAHNYEKDTVFFLTKSLTDGKTIYGVSCYRQMNSKDLVNKTEDVTRSSVQKSVCVLSSLPLFGLIKAKLELITHAYFDQRDFTIVSLLEDTYNSLKGCITENLIETQLCLGLSVRDLVLRYKHKIVTLFKLIMLERKVLFYMAPVEKLCSTVLTMLSLFPCMIENGLAEATSYSCSRMLTPTLKIRQFGRGESGEYLEIEYKSSGDKDEIPSLRVEQSLSESSGSSHTLPEKCDSENMEKRETLKTKDNEDSDHYVKLDVSDHESITKDKKASQKHPQPQVDKTEEKVPKNHSRASTSSLGSNKSIMLTENDIPDLPEVFHPHKNTGKHRENESTNIESKTTRQDSGDFSINTIPGHVELISPSEEKDVDLISDIKTVGSETPHDVLLSVDTTRKLSFDIADIDSPEGLIEIDAEDRFQWNQEQLKLTMLSDSDQSESVDQDHVKSLTNSDQSECVDQDHVKSLTNSEECLEVKSNSKTTLPNSSEEIRQEPMIFVNENYKPVEGESLENHHLSEHPPEQIICRDESDSVKKLMDETDQPMKEGTPERIVKTAQEVRDRLVSVLSKKKSTSVEYLERVEPTGLKIDEMGMPLSIFTKGSLCHPYTTLHQYDMLEDVNVRSFVIGATNVLFKQRRHLTDVVVGDDELKLDIRDQELKRCLHLTSADLRFADHLVKHVQDESDGLFLDGTEWEGGDEWLRGQFRVYLVSLMSTVLQDDAKMLEDFNVLFVDSWKTTHNYKVWRNTLQEIKDVQTGHPFHGQTNFSDMRLRFTTNMQGTEKGRRLNAAVAQTGKVVSETSKVVGGALTQAKSAVSSWFSGFGSKGQGQITEKKEDE